MATPQISARFDDQRGSFSFRDPVEIITAFRLDDVLPALEAVEAAAAAGRWCGGYVAYEAGPAFDGALVTHDPLPDLPLVWFGVFRGRQETTPPVGKAYLVERWYPNINERTYSESIDRIKAYIAAGDSYQVNHTFRLRSDFRGDPAGLYAQLVSAQRGDYSALLGTGRFHIASASPELFFKWVANRIEVKPMKGTTRRGRWAAEDALQADWLLASEKDRAENLMIVDLLRNDVGKLAEIGSVRVERLFALERYETVWQLTSTISAQLPPTTRLRDIFGGLFPSGSVTGAPKARTMEIIEELEIDPRGIYCGAIGWVGPGSTGVEAEFNVAIRTVVIDELRQAAEFGVGGGITWDSTTEGEYQEALWKTAILDRRRPEFDLFETLRWDGDYVLSEAHLTRIMDSAEYFGFSVSRADLEFALKAQARQLAHPSRVRLTLARSGEVTTEITGEFETPFSDQYSPDAPAISVALAPGRIQPHDPFLYHKTTHREVYEVASAAVAADEPLLVNAHGELTEGSISNLVVRIDGVWYTPPLASGCLPGTYRAQLLDAGRIRERVLRPEDLLSCEAIALINSVRGWRRARLVPSDQLSSRSTFSRTPSSPENP